VVSENSDAGPPGGSPAGPAGRAARAVQQAGGGARSKSLVLGAVETAPGCVRVSLRDCLAKWGLRHLTESAEVIASELVANAVAASSKAAAPGTVPASVTFWGSVQHGEVCIRVSDPDPTPPPRDYEPALMDENGRGLMIIKALSDRWGWYPASNGGKCVWATLAASAAARPLAGDVA
jgi:anti-sigma regulatory factor (Ser/Thr protein kinase)